MARGQEVPAGTQIVLPSGYVNEKTEEGGWKYTHRIVMEKHLGRELEPYERVHFTNPDADKRNPKIEDLELRVVKKRTLAAMQKRLTAIQKEAELLNKEIQAYGEAEAS